MGTVLALVTPVAESMSLFVRGFWLRVGVFVAMPLEVGKNLGPGEGQAASFLCSPPPSPFDSGLAGFRVLALK